MKLIACFVLAAAVLVVPARSEADPVIIEVPGYAKRVMGSVDTRVGTSISSRRRFYSFRSLHYAASPTNETRFLPPIPSNYPYPDDEIYNAVELSPGCPQGSFINENCLILSIYTPYLPGNESNPPTSFEKNLPVLYWIHGGSFLSGQNIIYEPQTFMDFDIVIVQVQYRLGPLGFLSLDTDEIPGNAGMFDQIEGLKWTKKFIKYFGGNPDQVTIMGESAGAASVSFLLLAPQARGLFRHAIAESGSMLADWALDRNAKNNGMRIAELAECPLSPYADLLHCLRNIDVMTLRNAQRAFSIEDMKKGNLGFGGQSPVIQYAGAERALEREPRAIIADGDYAVEAKLMFGANKHEGMYVATVVYEYFIVPNNLENDEEWLKYEMVPTLLKSLGIRDDTGILADTLYDKYFGYAVEAGQEGNFTYLLPGLVDLGGVLFLKAGGWETILLHTQFNPSAYWYSFDYRARYNLLGYDPIIPPGVGHADELMYLWLMPFPHNESEKLICQQLRNIWVNFIQHGDPTPDGVDLVEGIPKFPQVTDKDKAFVAINEKWEVRNDYTNYYTVSVDDMLELEQQNNIKKPVSSKSTGAANHHRRQSRHPRDLAAFSHNKPNGLKYWN